MSTGDGIAVTSELQWQHHPAAARFLASDEGSALSAWAGAGIAMVSMFAAVVAAGAAFFFWQRHRAQNGNPSALVVQKVQVKSATDPGKKAWPDPEAGTEPGESDPLDKTTTSNGTSNGGAVSTDKLSASVRLELCETLRGVLEEEISRGLKASGISDRLDRLEMQAKEQQVLSGSLLPPSTSKRGAPAPSEVPEPAAVAVAPHLDATIKPQALVAKRDALVMTDPTNPDGSALSEERSRSISQCGSHLALSPSSRQKRYCDPPERGWMHVDEDKSLRVSLVTVQRNLARRDSQTQELHRQLRQTEQDCVKQKLEAAYASRKLQDLLSNPTFAPQAQAAELQSLRTKVEDLASRLADSKSAEIQWCVVAKRQKAFFMQSERVATEGVNLFRKHPAGELFLAPPPVYLEDDVDEDPRRPMWDVGSSHINPYAIDSWPFEPNACAQRCAVEPNLSRWDEEDGIIDSDSEDGLSHHSSGSAADRERAQLMLRLPTLPPETSPHDEEFEPPEPTEPPEPLMTEGAMSSRSM